MILPDINLLLYAYNEALPQHAAARAWWENLMTNERAVAIPWAVAFGFIRLTTYPTVFRDPLPPLKPSNAYRAGSRARTCTSSNLAAATCRS